MKEDYKTNDRLETEEPKDDYNIREHDINLFKKLSQSLLIVISLEVIILSILSFIDANILQGIFYLIAGVSLIALITSLSRLIINAAYTAKKNQDTLVKLTKALENNDTQTIENIHKSLTSKNRQCPVCFCDLPEDCDICTNCGYDFDNPQDESQYMSNIAQENECPNCFSKVSPSDTECPNCGYKLKEDKNQDDEK